MEVYHFGVKNQVVFDKMESLWNVSTMSFRASNETQTYYYSLAMVSFSGGGKLVCKHCWKCWWHVNDISNVGRISKKMWVCDIQQVLLLVVMLQGLSYGITAHFFSQHKWNYMMLLHFSSMSLPWIDMLLLIILLLWHPTVPTKSSNTWHFIAWKVRWWHPTSWGHKATTSWNLT